MIYFDIFRFQLLRNIAYPFELLAHIFKRVIWIFFLIYFWTLIAQGNDAINIRVLGSYFLIATGVSDITMAAWGFLSHFMGMYIKDGNINNLLIKPLSIIPSIYAISAGRNAVRLGLMLLFILAGLIINPPQSVLSVALFLAFLLNALLISFAKNILEGTMYFHLTDAWGIRSSLNHLITIFSGAQIPLYLFPDTLRQILMLSPFPYMVYAPTHALTINSLNYEVLVGLAVGLFWAIVLNITALLFWRVSIKKYEAIGI
jgi:ABC-2 type transport system permease protein